MSKWLAALLTLSAGVIAADNMPWTFNGQRAEGYSIDLISVEPAAGTPLVRGSSVEIKINAKYAMSIKPEGQVFLVIQDEKNKRVEATKTPASIPVTAGDGTLTLTAMIAEVPKSKEIRVFVPLSPKGLEETNGEIVIRYPIVKKR
jgi:hypothetical protein